MRDFVSSSQRVKHKKNLNFIKDIFYFAAFLLVGYELLIILSDQIIAGKL